MAEILKKCMLLVGLFGLAGRLLAQSPAGPVTPKPGQPVQQAPAGAQVQVRVTLVNTPVTVHDAKGNLVNDLDAKDFRVIDNGVEQKISHFDFGGDPVSLVILVETSSRIDPILPEMRKTGILFTQIVMGPEGEAAVVGFNDAVDKLQDFTKDADLVENTLSHLRSGSSGSKLYDAMAVGVEMLSGRPQLAPESPGRRRVLFVLSETVDVGSETKLGAILRQAQLANVTIYSVGLSTTRSQLQSKTETRPGPSTPPGTFPVPPPPGTVQTPTTAAGSYGDVDLLGLAVWVVQSVKNQVKDHAMDVAAAATGGTHLSTYKDRSIEKAIDEIGGELHAQYVIGYTPSGGSDLGYHEIKVQVNRKGLSVRARPGYYVAAPQG